MRWYKFLCVVFWVAASCAGPASASIFSIEGDTVGVAARYSAAAGENIYDIARRFDLGFLELAKANPDVDLLHLRKGTEIFLPTAYTLPRVREGIVIDLSALRLFYFDGPGKVYTFPVSVGKTGWVTPLGTTKVTRKKKDPAWIPPESIRKEDPALPAIVPAGPDNPLGLRALYLAWPGYAIHGTNRPSSIGKRVSHGCIRLYPEDIALLFEIVKPGTPVTITGLVLSEQN